MKCESVAERITLLAAGTLPDDQRNACMNHIAGCAGCADALQGAVAMHTVQAQAVAAAPDGLFDRVMRQTTRAPERRGCLGRLRPADGWMLHGPALLRSLRKEVIQGLRQLVFCK